MKKAGKKISNTSTTELNDLKKLVILIIIIVFILGIIYFITKAFEKKDYSNIFNNSLDTAEIQYQEIMLGTLFQQGDGEYYVLVIDDKDNSTNIFKSYVSTYQEAKHKIPLYTVDLNNVFNKNAKASQSNYIKGQLKFRGTTLLRIKGKEIKETLDQIDQINNRFLELNK